MHSFHRRPIYNVSANVWISPQKCRIGHLFGPYVIDNYDAEGHYEAISLLGSDRFCGERKLTEVLQNVRLILGMTRLYLILSVISQLSSVDTNIKIGFLFYMQRSVYFKRARL